MVRFIVVTGGVLSGLGKGVVTSSIGAILKAQGYRVAAIKVDPYINVDAGTMRPTEHGEVWVTDDGGETDQDLGSYERFIGNNILKDQSITTGQVYLKVINDERNLKFDGKCVEVIPHIPLEVRRRILSVGKRTKSDFVLIEIGGTVGDYQSVLFLEAVREMRRDLGNTIFVHVAYLPIPRNIGEMKTKPAQHSVRALNEVGIQPDFLVARSEKPLDDIRREKLAVFCNIDKNNVISAPDIDSVYKVPLLYDKQGFCKQILKKFNLRYKSNRMKQWQQLARRIETAKHEVKVGVVGKYFDIGEFTLEDSYVSVIEAIKHACWLQNAKPVIQWIDSKEFEKNKAALKKLSKLDAMIVPGGFGKSGVEGKILAVEYARKNNIPYLGLCYGMQLAVVEFARNVCKMKGAMSTEFGATKYPVIDILPEQKEKLAKQDYGGTMRLGAYPAKLKKGSLVAKLYGKPVVSERHRHRYEVNPEYIETLEQHGLLFSGVSPDRTLMEFMELPGHKYFVATQAHPEFKSTPFKPAPLFAGLIKAALRR